MRYVIRSTESRIFKTPPFQIERQNIKAFYGGASAARTQKSYDWSNTDAILDPVKDDLESLFYAKCAYCEDELTDKWELDHFRPRGGALGVAGDFDPDHYWWLALDWRNLVPACSACSASKGKRFPVRRFRTPIGKRGMNLVKERSLLLDPCILEKQIQLVFSDDGLVSGITDDGRTTIDVMSLNRETLQKKREKEIADFRLILDALASSVELTGSSDRYVKSPAFNNFVEALGVERLFLVAKRQTFFRWCMDRNYVGFLQFLISPEMARRRFVFVRRYFRQKNQLTVAKSEKLVQKEKDRTDGKTNYSVLAKGDDAATAYFSGVRRIERISIKNFKSIKSLELTMPAAAGERIPWMMFLGENAAGKSSILQAVALCLAGGELIKKLGVDARKVVSYGETEGSVTIQLTNVASPIVLSFNAKSPRFVVMPPNELVLLLGYGATRLLPRSATTARVNYRYVPVKNLFNPFARLHDVEEYLCNRTEVKDPLFDAIGYALKQLLLIDEDGILIRKNKKITVRVGNVESSLAELSDGFQSVVALAVDIIVSISKKWTSMQAAEGVVLIDEIETHLHPTWKMLIVSRLRAVFPRLTFLATTHDPLCLRGLIPGEIVVLRHDNQGLTARVVTESIAHLRADQLLTSPLFGLMTTRDPSAIDDQNQYLLLLSKQNRSEEDEKKLQELRTTLASTRVNTELPLAGVAQRALEIALQEEPKISPTSFPKPPVLQEDLINVIKARLTALTTP